MQSSRSRAFQAAKTAKKDEFYTRLEEIEAEVSFYPGQFVGKTVYMNCDDPSHSNFFRFFANNFHSLGIKRLLASGFKVDCRGNGGASNGLGVWAEYTGIPQDPKSLLPGQVELRTLSGDGDFRSAEAIRLLEEADIVVTNPPFSLFSEYVNCLMDHDKELLILGNMNALTYRNVFPLFQQDLLWYGKSIHSGDREFLVPFNYPLEAANSRMDDAGNKYIRVKGVRWFTNLVPSEGFEGVSLTKEFSAQQYPQYVNYPAIEVSRTRDIPRDYYGEMGVPISFMAHYDPRQFNIIGSSKELALPMDNFAEPGTYQNGGPRFYLHTNTGFRRMYERIVIKRRPKDSM